uniref:Las1-domain-containing protein n=1 Tax=Mycena chlorophos TaxID=658473 RepID=A0ABQ0KXW9_MYCCL|nr:predicted protein [Mycena chlorophos]
MRLPRRVPWATIGELDELCTWIYADESDVDAKVNAINRLTAWSNITALPHALDATLALLCVIVQDLQPLSSYLSLRHGYAAAIIRLVNGLVDPLQQGLYARSIASIANQLGLPAWLVELRHAATHENLPSLELLRQAARESMAWLLHNYFLPTINPSTTLAAPTPSLRPLGPLLKQYKTLSKLVTRDATLRTQQLQIQTVLRDVERWIAEAAVAARVATGVAAWTDEKPRERWALERLCDALLDKAALVPLSKKKRIFPRDDFYPPPAAVAIWSPLLRQVSSVHLDLPFVLVNRIIAYLTADVAPEEFVVISPDTTYDACLARWAFWTLQTLSPGPDSKRDVLIALATGLGPALSLSRDFAAANSMMQALCVGDPELQRSFDILVQPLPVRASDWSPHDISVMDERLAALLALPESSVGAVDAAPPGSGPDIDATIEIAPGWRLLGSDSSWRASPIGVHVAG